MTDLAPEQTQVPSGMERLEREIVQMQTKIHFCRCPCCIFHLPIPPNYIVPVASRRHRHVASPTH